MKVIHVFEDTPHHYLPMMAFFKEYCKDMEPQEFWAFTPSKSEKDSTVQYYEDEVELSKWLKATDSSAVILIHGSFRPKTWLKLCLHKKLKQSSYIFWGAELYRYQKQLSFKQLLIKKLHQLMLKRMRNLVCLNSGDALLAEKLTGKKDIAVIQYPLQTKQLSALSLSAIEENAGIEQKTKELRILAGNSAAASNNHKELIDLFYPHRDKPLSLIMTLNYGGSSEYVNEIVHYGKERLGDRFFPITQMLSKSEHNELLASVDGCVFGHERQQGLFVAYAMLYLNRHVFMKQAVSSFDYLSGLGFNIKSTESIQDMSWQQLLSLFCECQNSRKIVEQRLVEEALAPKWEQFVKRQISCH